MHGLHEVLNIDSSAMQTYHLKISLYLSHPDIWSIITMCFKLADTVDGMIFRGFQFSWMDWSMNSSTHELAIFCMNYKGKYFGHKFWTPRMCQVCSTHENWYPGKYKRPKGPHIVHLSTMCHLFDRSARWTEKHKLGRGRWGLASCQVSFIILFSGFRGEVENISDNQRPEQPSCFSDWPEKHKLGRGRWDLASCQVSMNSVQRFQRRSRKMSQPTRGQGGQLLFPIGPKNKILVEDIEILLPVMFHWILFSGFRGEVENVSANQRPGQPFYFSDRPEKHKLGRGC